MQTDYYLSLFLSANTLKAIFPLLEHVDNQLRKPAVAGTAAIGLIRSPVYIRLAQLCGPLPFEIFHRLKQIRFQPTPIDCTIPPRILHDGSLALVQAGFGVYTREIFSSFEIASAQLRKSHGRRDHRPVPEAAVLKDTDLVIGMTHLHENSLDEKIPFTRATPDSVLETAPLIGSFSCTRTMDVGISGYFWQTEGLLRVAKALGKPDAQRSTFHRST